MVWWKRSTLPIVVGVRTGVLQAGIPDAHESGKRDEHPWSRKTHG